MLESLAHSYFSILLKVTKIAELLRTLLHADQIRQVIQTRQRKRAVCHLKESFPNANFEVYRDNTRRTAVGEAAHFPCHGW